MKKNFAYGLFALLIAVASCSFTNKTFENDDKDKLLLDLITYVLNKGHYEPKDINDDFSVNVFEDFIDVIDPTKRYFLASDIAEFEKLFASEEMKELVKNDFNKARKLGVNSFPTLLLQTGEEVHVVARGFASKATMIREIDKILKAEIK